VPHIPPFDAMPSPSVREPPSRPSKTRRALRLARSATASLALVAIACGATTLSSSDAPPSDGGVAARGDAGSPSEGGEPEASTQDALAPGDGSALDGGGDLDAAAESVTYVLPFVATANGLANGLNINVSVGGGPSHEVMLDTGSEALIVPANVLGAAVQTPSPAVPFTTEFTSDGYILTGEIVTASIALGVSYDFDGGTPKPGLPVTVPMPVHVLESVTCDTAYPDCKAPGDLSSFGILGVGFGRDLSATPASNALLQITDVAAGVMRPGYILSNNPPQLTVGIPESTADFARIALTASSNGDWLATSLPGCVLLPSISWSLCGGLLVDTGIDFALVSVPQGTTSPYEDAGSVPLGTPIEMLAPNDGSVMTSASDVGASSLQSPPTVQFRHPPGSTPMINTGRRVLAIYDYLFDARGGEVGFRKVAQ
jgi:hypothetical protein